MTIPENILNAVALHATMPISDYKAMETAVEKLQKTIMDQPINYNELADYTDCYTIPLTQAHILFLQRLLGCFMSDSFAEDGCVSTLVDSILKSLYQARGCFIAQPFISIYNAQECYGGPEEGGWWYWHYEHHGSVSYDTKEEMMEFLRSQCEYYSTMSDNELPNLEEVLDHDKLYEEFEWFLASTDESAAVYKRLGYETIGDITGQPQHSRTIPLWQDNSYHAHEQILLVFEWQPGSLATLRRPHYC